MFSLTTAYLLNHGKLGMSITARCMEQLNILQRCCAIVTLVELSFICVGVSGGVACV